MADTNTLDLSDLSSEPVESNVQAEISDAPDTEEVDEPVEALPPGKTLPSTTIPSSGSVQDVVLLSISS